MSIWCSGDHVGTDIDGEHSRGAVLTYACGFSNHFPNLDGTHELPAAVEVADIAPWCVPGHDQTEALGYACSGCGESHDHPETGRWLRLGLYAEAGLTFWGDPKPHRESFGADVVMDEAAVKALRDDLTRWLEKPKVREVLGLPGGGA